MEDREKVLGSLLKDLDNDRSDDLLEDSEDEGLVFDLD